VAQINVAIINSSTVLADSAIQAAVPALQIQVRRDFAPVRGIDANIEFVRKGAIPDPGAWWLLILDTASYRTGLWPQATSFWRCLSTPP
jgi:hypothetical protein